MGLHPRFFAKADKKVSVISSMPEIIQSYSFDQLDPEGLYQDILNCLKEIGIQELQEKILEGGNFAKEVGGIVPSIWGWGGMKIDLKVYQENNITNVDLKGFIAQLSTTPLTKSIDQFLSILAGKLKNRLNYQFTYEPLTRFLPKFKLNFTSADKQIFIVIIVVAFITTLAGTLFGRGFELLATSTTLGLGYYFGRKLLSQKK